MGVFELLPPSKVTSLPLIYEYLLLSAMCKKKKKRLTLKTVQHYHKIKEAIAKHKPRTVCFDANISTECMKATLEACRGQDIHSTLPLSYGNFLPPDREILGHLIFCYPILYH